MRRTRAPVALATAVTFILGMGPHRAARADEAPPREEVPAPAPAPTAAPTPASHVDVVSAAAQASRAPAVVEHAPAPPSRVDSSRVDQVAPVDVERPSGGGAPTTPIVDSLAVGGDKTGVSSQAISVPQGAGKIQGMGESFSTQMSTGVATFSVPFSLPDARGGSQPSLTLSYSSGDGHGIAGVGWGIGWPYIARQTDRGLPNYNDQANWQPQQDRFVFNGGQELVPICTVSDGGCSGALHDEIMPSWGDGWQYFRSRVEGSYLRFFWSPNHQTWRVQSKSGESMELGASLDSSGDTSAIESDPLITSRIFRWNLTRQYDNEGSPPPAGATAPAPVNVVVYRYTSSGNMAYLSDVYDTPPAANSTSAPVSAYAHHTRLLYQTRPDATSSYRRGWRTDSLLRLTGVDVTSATFLGGAGRHDVRRYHLTYDPTSHVSLLTSVQLEGRCTSDEASAPAEDSNGNLPAVTGCDTLPAMAFGYQHVTPYNVDGSPGSADLAGYEGFDERIIHMSGSPPNSIDEDVTDLFDINGDSLPDVVNTLPGASGRYPMYLNGGSGTRDAFTVSSLGLVGALGATANDIQLSNENVAVSDIDGDGIINWLHQPAVGSVAVYTPTLLPGGWSMVGRAVANAANQSPHLDFGDDTPDINVLDVNGDGLVDVVRTTGTEMQTFFALGRYPGGDGNFGSATWTGPNSAALSLQAVTSCVPLVSTGVPIRFSDSTIVLGDMNGDGLQDIVFLQPGNVKYWPGRGDGSWGIDGPCVSGFAPNTYIAMANGPQYSDPNGVGLRIDDVNGDGLDDLVDVQFDNVQVWLNVDGAGWTAQPHIISGVTPASGPLWVGKVRLVDVDGTGTRDILWGEGGAYRYIDLQGGERPWILTHIANGLGKTTDIQYQSATTQMLAATVAGVPWASVSPVPLQVVSQVTDGDNVAVAGRPAGTYVTQYLYRDPVYDGRQREFRGFRSSTATKIGDANSPTAISASAFLLGDCADDEPPPFPASSRCAPDGRWTDNVREALKGVPASSETSDVNGVYATTAHHQYTLRKLYVGQDGREVRVAFESKSDTWSYDTAAFASSPAAPAMADVVLDNVQGPEPSTPLPLTVRAASGTAHMQSSDAVDLFGNSTSQLAYGCVDGAACAIPDEVIATTTRPQLLDPTASGWLWRTAETWVEGADQVQRMDTTTTFDANGDPTTTSVSLTGSLPLDRAMPGGNAAPSASADGTVTLSRQTYDGFGNVVSQSAPNGRCRDITYPSDYADMATSETVYVGQPGGSVCAAGGGVRGARALTAVAGYDRGVAAVTNVIDIHQEPSFITHDAFGRLTSLTKPSAAAQTLSALPSVLVDYDMASPGRPYSIIHTQSLSGATESDATYHNAYQFTDGLGRALVTFNQADPGAGDGGQWVVNGLTAYDSKGASELTYLAWFWSGDPHAYPLQQAPATTYSRQRYDAFERQIQTFGLDQILVLQTAYHALSVDRWDAADLQPGPHQGTYASSAKDGHGRDVSETERAHVGGAIEARTTRMDFLATGEPYRITRTRGAGDDVVRWVRYDSLGRMVLNVDPNTTKNFSGVVSTDPRAPVAGGMRAWRYAYNDNGDLVGTSDARGCGSNYIYDTAGRVVVEDYWPCAPTQAPYSAPNLATGDGAEVFYQYDALDATLLQTPGVTPSGDDEDAGVADGGAANSTATIDACSINESLLLGRLVAVSDRGSQTVTTYDGRGRDTCVARQIARPGVPSDTVAARYAPRWYSRSVSYDGADRPVQSTTGARVVVDPATQQSFVKTSYTMRGLVKNVASSYGDVVTSVAHDADGLIQAIGYGDAASTTTALTYDQRRRLSSLQTFRGAPSLWSASPAPPGYTLPDGSTSQRLLADLDYHYDSVDNPVEIDDWRSAGEWPAGAQPVTRKIQYDDLYRLTRTDYQYASGSDPWVDPFAAEDGSDTTQHDPRRAQPSPHLAFDSRALSQSYQYDWLGNTTNTDDDAKGFYDRSLGAITNGAPTAGPYQLKSANGGVSPRDGALTTQYDDAGNLVGLSVVRNASAPCLPTGAPCSQRFAYDWDEVGRLAHATRWDGTTLGSAQDPLPADATPIAAELTFAYDNSNDRVLKTASDAQGEQLHTVYIFDSLELRRTTFDEDYEVSTWTESAYLFVDDLRLARIYYAADDVPTLSSGTLHVLLELPDALGSSAVVLDRATGELVEASAYEVYGATDSDYRPTRWASYRDDYRFTGKEEDAEVGLIYFGERYYSPWLNRWTSPDPEAVHELGADLNLYAYVHGRALKATDPFGLDANAPIPVSSAAWKGGIQLYPIAEDSTPAVASSDSSQARTAGVFRLVPMLDSDRKVLFYTAVNTDFHVAWYAVAADKLDLFETNAVAYHLFAASYFGANGRGPQTSWEIKSGKAIQFAMGADWSDAIGALKSGWGDAISDPGWWANVIVSLTALEEKAVPTGGGDVCPCFAAGTVVATPNGPRRIELVAIGDIVNAENPETGEVAPRRVVAVRVTDDQPIVELVLALGDDTAREDVLDATAGHPFWVPRRGGWVLAGDLYPGDAIATASGAVATLVSGQTLANRTDVFNLEVEGDHTYFVGTSAALVHNGCKCSSAQLKTLEQNKLQGQVGQTQGVARIEGEGKKVLGQEVGVRAQDGTLRKFDALTKEGKGYVNNEIKSGNAQRSAQQIRVDADLQKNGGTFVGKNAPKNLRGKPTGPVRTRVVRVSGKKP